jgi:regulatory protein
VPHLSRPESLRDPDDATACRHRGMDLLSRREHSRLELERKLTERGFGAECVQSVLDRLQEDNLLNEGRFVESFVRARVGKGQGPTRIYADLSQRGVDMNRARVWLEQAEVNWPSLAAGVREKRFGSGRPQDLKARARQARFLEYRGFDRQQIEAALELAGESD